MKVKIPIADLTLVQIVQISKLAYGHGYLLRDPLESDLITSQLLNTGQKNSFQLVFLNGTGHELHIQDNYDIHIFDEGEQCFVQNQAKIFQYLLEQDIIDLS